MSLHHSAKKLYARGQTIPVCIVAYSDYIAGRRNTLDIKINGHWLYDFLPPIRDYGEYILTMSPLEKDLCKYCMEHSSLSDKQKELNEVLIDYIKFRRLP